MYFVQAQASGSSKWANNRLNYIILVISIIVYVYPSSSIASVHFERSLPIAYKDINVSVSSKVLNLAVEVSFINPCRTINGLINLPDITKESMVKECDDFYNSTITAALIKIRDEKFLKMMPHLRTRRSPREFYVGSFVTNMVEISFDRAYHTISPGGSKDELAETQIAIYTIQERWGTRQILNQAVGGGLYKNITEVYKSMKERLAGLEGSYPALISYHNYLTGKMLSVANSLERLGFGFRYNLLDMEGFNELTNSSWPKNLEVSSTALMDMRIFGKPETPTLRIEFRGRLIEKDTLVLQVEGINHLVNLTHGIVEVEYAGPSYIIYNTTNNCVKSVDASLGRYVDESCTQRDYFDSRLSIWKRVRSIDDLESYEAKTQVVEAEVTLVSCFREVFTINGESAPCPYYVFSLPLDRSWRTGSYNHKRVQSSSGEQAAKRRIPQPHYKHVHDTLASVDETELILKLREINRARRETESRSSVASYIRVATGSHDLVPSLAMACLVLTLLLMLMCFLHCCCCC